jgi:glycosyltransferase involved in cell wall biosynthesis
MTVSVVMPTYNRGSTIGEAIESVLNQTYGDLELIVADDGSTDDTRERIAATADPRLRYFAFPHAGVSIMRNHALARAQGELVAFCDSDDVWKPDKLERQVAFLRGHPEVQGVFSDFEKWDGEQFVPSFTRASAVFSKTLQNVAYPNGVALDQRDFYLCLLQESPVLPTVFMIRRQALDQVGGFANNAEPFEDWKWFIRLARVHRFGYLDVPLAVVRVSRDSIHRVQSERGRTAMLRLFSAEIQRCGDDREARQALRRGIVHLRKHLGWYYWDRGQRVAALRSHLRGFRETHDPQFLARAASIAVPRVWWSLAQRALTRHGGRAAASGSMRAGVNAEATNVDSLIPR